MLIIVFVITIQPRSLKAEKSLESSFIYIEQLKINYSILNYEISNLNESVEENTSDYIENDKQSYKSPTKAFLYSLAVPGLGQYYNGNSTKPFVFLGVEIISWVFYIKWHTDGNDITDEFEAFNRANWSQNRYEDYLRWNYNGIDDDELINAPEITHHLPDTRTQQYYEITGKYDQFGWGWVDAMLNDSTWDDYNSSNPPPKITSSSRSPQSALREYYESRRNDANNMYDRAQRMIYLTLLNRIVSAFEAMVVSKKINKNIRAINGFNAIKLDTDFKSYYSLYDTPSVTLKYIF